MRIDSPRVPGVIGADSPVRSPGCGMASPLLLTRAATTTLLAPDKRAAGDMADESSRVKLSGRSGTRARRIASGMRAPSLARAKTKTVSPGAALAASAGARVTVPLTAVFAADGDAATAALAFDDGAAAMASGVDGAGA